MKTISFACSTSGFPIARLPCVFSGLLVLVPSMSGNDSQKESALARFFNFFASTKLTVFVLLLLAAVSIMGTVVPQNEPVRFYAEKYSEFVFRLFSSLGIFDMYRSWWFQALLLILAINLLVCSVKRFPSAWKQARLKNPGFRKALFEKLSGKQSFVLAGPVSAARDKVAETVSRKFAYVKQAPAEEGFTVYAEKGRWTRLGPYVVHLGFLLVLAGGLVGSLYGFKAYTQIPEGETVDRAFSRTGHKEYILPFQVRCDDFTMSHYENGMVKEYRSTLTIIRDGKPLFTRDIIVNDPLRFQGINLFQSSFGKTSPKEVDLVFKDKKDGSNQTITASLGERLTLPGGRGEFMAAHFHDAFTVRGENFGPMFVLNIFPKEGQAFNMPVFVHMPDFNMQKDADFTFSVKSYEAGFYTGLQVTRDPGVVYVYAGFILIILGCFITFFIAHQKVFIKGEQTAGKVRVTLAGDANRNRQGFLLYIKRLAARLEAGK